MTDELELPVPEVEPQPITYGQYRTLTPEKLELYDGYLIDPPHRHQGRMKLLAALLVNEGLARTVELVPQKRWQEALERVYGTGDGRNSDR